MIAWHPAPRHQKIQGSKGQSVLNRSTYTAAGYVTLKSKIQIKTPRAEIKYHQLYFPISDHDFGDDPLEIWHMAIDAEPRWDAVQAWKSEFTFPRCLNLEQQIEFANRFASKSCNLAFEISHASFTRIVTDQIANGAIFNLPFSFSQTMILADFWDEMPDRDL